MMDEPPGNGWRRSLVSTPARITLASVGFGCLGLTGGWALGAGAASGRPTPAAPTVTVSVPAVVAGDVTMPDVRGLSAESAKEVLGDAGVAAPDIRVTVEPAAGPSDRVVSQSTAPGSPVSSGVTLSVSALAVMPALTGKPRDSAVRSLSLLGAEPAVTPLYRPGASPGTVLVTSPAAGRPLPASVTLTVAAAPTSVFLSTLDPVDGGCSRSSEAINGRTYDNSVRCGADSEGRRTAWVTSRAADFLVATVGIPDDGDPSAQAVVVVRADGRQVAALTARYGRPAALNARVTGALRIELEVRSTSAAASPDVALGDARLVGGPSLSQLDGAGQ